MQLNPANNLHSDATPTTVGEPDHLRSRIPVLDGLRGVAVLMALYCHAGQVDSTEMSGKIDNLVLTTARLSWAAADLFFVLSGFLITAILLENRERPNLLRDFYGRRAVRIIPLYFVFLAVFLVILPMLFAAFSTRFGQLDGYQIWYWTFLSSFSHGWMRQKGFGMDHVVSPSWTLAIEVHFYLLWPLLVQRLRPEMLLKVCILIFLAAIGIRSGLELSGLTYIASYATPCRFDGIALGAALAIIARDPARFRSLVAPAKIALPACVLAIGFILVLMQKMNFRRGPYYSPGYIMFGPSLMSLVFGSLIVLILHARRGGLFNRLFENPVFRIYGKFGYGIYLLHLPLFILVADYVFRPARLHAGGTHLPGMLIYIAIVFALSLLLGAISWHGFEKHFLRLRASFISDPHERAS